MNQLVRFQRTLVSLKTDMLERQKAPVVEGQGESEPTLQAKSPSCR